MFVTFKPDYLVVNMYLQRNIAAGQGLILPLVGENYLCEYLFIYLQRNITKHTWKDGPRFQRHVRSLRSVDCMSPKGS